MLANLDCATQSKTKVKKTKNALLAATFLKLLEAVRDLLRAGSKLERLLADVLRLELRKQILHLLVQQCVGPRPEHFESASVLMLNISQSK